MTRFSESSAIPRWMLTLRWIVLFVVFAPFVLVQRDIWDGSIAAFGLATHDFRGIYDWLVPSNWGLQYLTFRLIHLVSEMTFFPSWLLIKLILVCSVVGISHEARLFSTEVLRWDQRNGFAVGLVALSFPCWYLLYGSTFIYIVFVWWVFLGHRLLYRTGYPARQAIGFVVLLASFQVNSNFVMVFALEAVRFLCRDRSKPWHWRRSGLIALTAIACYAILRLVFPPNGLYQGYNNLVLPYSAAGLLAWFRATLMFLTWVPLLAVPGVLAWLLRGRSRSSVTSQPLPAIVGADGVGVVVLCAGALIAYIAVGKGAPLFVLNLPVEWLGTSKHVGQIVPAWIYTTVDGWSARLTFLFSFPASIASIYLVRRVLGDRADAPALLVWRAALVAGLTVNLCWLTYGHAAKQLRLAQEQSIVRALKERPAPAPGKVDLLLPPVGWSISTYEANYIMWLAYGRSTWATAAYSSKDPYPSQAALARDSIIAERTVSKSYYLMTEFQPTECETVLVVQWPEGLGPLSLAAEKMGLSFVEPAALIETRNNCNPIR